MLPPTLTKSQVTIPAARNGVAKLRAALLTRAERLGWSQNRLARRAGYETGYFSKVLTGRQQSLTVWRVADQALKRGEREQAARKKR